MEDIEMALREARVSESPVDQFRYKSMKTSFDRINMMREKDGKVRAAFDAGYLRGRRDHLVGAFGHSAFWVWGAFMAGMLSGAGLLYIGQYAV